MRNKLLLSTIIMIMLGELFFMRIGLSPLTVADNERLKELMGKRQLPLLTKPLG